TVLAPGRDIRVRDFAAEQFPVEQDEVFERQLVGKRRSGHKSHFYFQPKLALITLVLLRSAVTVLRRRNEVLRNFAELKFARPSNLGLRHKGNDLKRRQKKPQNRLH